MKNPNIYPFSVQYESYQGNSIYHVTFPDFPNAEGSAETLEEAIECGRESLETVMEAYEREGKKIPNPKPIRLEDEATGRVTLRLPKRLHAQLIREAEKDGVSLNTEVVAAVASFVGASNSDAKISPKAANGQKKKNKGVLIEHYFL